MVFLITYNGIMNMNMIVNILQPARHDSICTI